ncbi:MAG: zinc-dependent metalloprotease [Cyclobacteriaceae bacterium]|nr:zinc-dependent metalloprotease [Cyclobacteriaceae bacterium]
MRSGFVLMIMLITHSVTYAQWKTELPPMQIKKVQDGTICYHKPEDSNLVIPPPAAYEAWRRNPAAKTTATTFEVTYVNFSTEAQQAFQKAVDIWSNLIESPVPIRILAVWQPISGSALGGASPGTYIRDFDGAQKVLTWYPVALAEKMTGREFNDADDPDIFAQFNSSFADWSFRTDGTPVSGKTDLVSVVLHEIGHGLGITKAYDINGTNGVIADFFSGLHVPYDHFLENNSDVNLVQGFDPPSAALRTELTSGALFFRSPLLPKNSIDNRARIYAPATFAGGSSIAHLDEATYNGTSHALMTPFIGNAEVMHNPGTLVMRMLADMGWVNIRIEHTKLPYTENVSSPYQVIATLQADPKNQDGGVYNYNAGEVKLNYTANGTAFTSVSMNPTGQPNQFSATIPATGSAITYGYYISVKDNQERTLVKPGVFTDDGASPVQRLFIFEAGPDTEAPEIIHTPKAFLSSLETQLALQAIVTDDLGIKEVTLEYAINNVVQTPIVLPANSSADEYLFTVPLPALQSDDEIKYRITARDLAEVGTPGGNVGYSPSVTEYHVVPVVGLEPTQDSYINNFDSPTDDFFGTGFSITTPGGFANGAIHTTHPYPEGNGMVNNEIELIYQLKIPVRVKEQDATLVFDEIVLVEPGETGSVFGSSDFYDYVVVEGSKDGGLTWTAVADGYDSRSNSAWLTLYNSAITGNNSTAVGAPSLFKPRSLNLLNKFEAGDEVVIRFRLYSDPFAAGWGWAIDNLRIQVDETAPAILHNHVDYLLTGASIISVAFQTTDASGLEEISVDIRVNAGEIETENIPVEEGRSQYGIDLDASNIPVGNRIEYRIRVKDTAGNEAVLPASGFFQVPVIEFGDPLTQYVADFNSTNTDFVGNFFSIMQPSGFTNGAMHTLHPYPNGFGLTNNTSNYILTLTKPITIGTDNTYIFFNEIAAIEYSGTGNKDYVVVEGSKDGGETWHELTGPYSALSQAVWKNVFDTGSAATSNAFRSRLINITAGSFQAGDAVLFRFRLLADGTGNGWGWAMDNLSIQGPVTRTKESADLFVSVYPNPANSDVFTLEIKGLPAQSAQVQVTNLQGQKLVSESLSLTGSTTHKEYSTATWADGVYVVRLNLEDGSTITKKLIKTSR